MDYLTLLLLAVGLSFDTFAISISCGLVASDLRFHHAFRMAVVFAFVQGLMPALGWLVGWSIQAYVVTFDHWIAFVLLAFLGGKMLYESFSKGGEDEPLPPTIKKKKLLGMAVATSVDAMVVGVSFALINMHHIRVAVAILIIAFVTGVSSMLGMLVGKHTGRKFGKKAEFVGGIILISIGLKVLLEHTVFQ